MKSCPAIPRKLTPALRQRGVVLFFTLIALVVMSLAAVALIRSVDTSTMIAGNLAFKQTATSSGDGGVETAIAWLAAQQQILTNSGLTVGNDNTTPPTLLFNLDNPSLGYYSSVRAVANLTNGNFAWTDAYSVLVNPSPDASGNTVRYIIERMCTTPNLKPLPQNCLFTTSAQSGNDLSVKSADQSCPTCTSNVQSPQLRITAQVLGPKNTYSYIQTFVY